MEIDAIIDGFKCAVKCLGLNYKGFHVLHRQVESCWSFKVKNLMLLVPRCGNNNGE